MFTECGLFFGAGMRHVLKGLVFTVLALLAGVILAGGCSSDTEQSPPGTSQPSPDPGSTPPPAGNLSLELFDPAGFEALRPDLDFKRGRDYFGSIYRGTYTARDGVSIDVWISVREKAATGDVGTVARTGVVIQGGTGTEVIYLLGADEGVHTFWVAINYRGSSLSDMTAERECLPGDGFVSCLQNHDTFDKINPQLNAWDANSVIGLLTGDDGEVTVNGVSMKASEFIPSGTLRSPVNLYTGSFGGVIVSHMLAQKNRPRLHNVFFEQVTAPSEAPISDGLNTAARAFDVLFKACEDDASCKAAYPGLRVNFRRFMDAYHSTRVEIDGHRVYAGAVFDGIRDIINDGKVGRAIRYMGEIANAHADGSTAINTSPYGPESYDSSSGGKPRATYGLPPLDSDSDGWTAFLKNRGLDFFPGITNRTAMICSFGINRVSSPDSLSYFDKVKAQELPGDSGGTKESFGYGFLVSYKTYLAVCPQLAEQTGGLPFPDVPKAGVEAENVVVFRGELDIKHYFEPNPEDDEIMAYFTSSPGHRRVITQKFFGQVEGQDRGCMHAILRNFWSAPDTSDGSLGDDCEESNSLTASGLDGWAP